MMIVSLLIFVVAAQLCSCTGVQLSALYDTQSVTQTNTAAATADAIADFAVKAFQETGRFCFADYGCAFGLQTSIYLRQIKQKLPEISHPASQPITVFLTDLQNNYWENAKMHLDNVDIRGLICHARPGSFYDKVLEDDSVSFAVSTTSVHWLPAADVPRITDAGTAAYTRNAEHRAQLNAAAKANWLKFLHHRSEELVGNGILFVSVPSRSSHLRQVVSDLRDEALRWLVATGQAPANLVELFTFPIAYLSARDRLQVIDHDVWSVVRAEEHPVPSEPWIEFKAELDKYRSAIESSQTDDESDHAQTQFDAGLQKFSDGIVTQMKSTAHGILSEILRKHRPDSYDAIIESFDHYFAQLIKAEFNLSLDAAKIELLDEPAQRFVLVLQRHPKIQ